jgi:DNA gyrase subunit B
MKPEDFAASKPVRHVETEYPVVSGHQVVSFEEIRKRPGMYVGGTGFSGFSHYLKDAILLLLEYTPKYIGVTVGEDYEIVSDAEIELTETEDGFIPFEVIGDPEGIAFHKFKRTWPSPKNNNIHLTALSRELAVSITRAQQRQELHFVRGVRTLYRVVPVENETLGTTLRFQPDSNVFTVTKIRQAVFLNYFRRLSYLYAGTRFSLSADGETHSFQADRGIEDLFAVLASPHRLLHEPISISVEAGDLKLQAVMGFHNGIEDHLTCFINNDLAVEGGTHVHGLRKALKRLRKQLQLPDRMDQVGTVAVMSLHYPHPYWQSTTTRKIINPDFQELVSRLVFEGALAWLKQHPAGAAQLNELEFNDYCELW